MTREKLRGPVVIVGAGGLGREFLDVIEAVNRAKPVWRVIGFIDDNPKFSGTKVSGYPVLGGSSWFAKPEATNVGVVVAIGDNRVRRRVVESISSRKVHFPNLIHPSAIVTRFVELGQGIVITAGCVLTNNISIGDNSILNLDCTVGHDTVLEKFVNLNPGVHINGNNHVKEGAYVGSGAVTIQGISLGRWSIVGAGAVVVRHVPDKVVAVGVPAKPIKGVE